MISTRHATRPNHYDATNEMTCWPCNLYTRRCGKHYKRRGNLSLKANIVLWQDSQLKIDINQAFKWQSTNHLQMFLKCFT